MTLPDAITASARRARGRVIAAAVLGLVSWAALAQGPDVVVAGTFPGKALLIIDGVPPRAVAVGQRTAGVRVVSVEGDLVTFEIDGQRQSLRPGDRVNLEVDASTQAVVDTVERVLAARTA